ncbi:MAG: hypothetical protein FWE33_02140 [Defluviitaleaceae bacterium]|nr:hypothetical protein [Defluviitaleaceae bacterium]
MSEQNNVGQPTQTIPTPQQGHYPPPVPKAQGAFGSALKTSFTDIFKNSGLNFWTRALKLMAWVQLILGLLLNLINAWQVTLSVVFNITMFGRFFTNLFQNGLTVFVLFFVLMTAAEVAKYVQEIRDKK